MTEPLTKVDSAVQGMETAPKETKRRASSAAANGVMNINDLGKWHLHTKHGPGCPAMADSDSSSQRPRELTCRLPRRHKGRGGKSACAATYTPWLPLTPPRRKINTSPTTVEDKEVLKKLLTTPPVKKIDLHFPLGLEVTARNLKGVTIKDALDAIHKQFKKRVSVCGSSAT
jgi:hypothetical protein